VTRNNIRIGTSGFSYRDWLGNFYPQFCPQADFLRYYATQFNTVELDVTFYRIPTAEMVERWIKVTPENFVFSAKFPRAVTHDGELSEKIDNAGHFVEVMQKLGRKLGPLLLQFPYSFKPDQFDTLRCILKSLPGDLKLSVEVRNKEWFCEDFFAYLRKRGIALCLVEHPWMPRLELRTADFDYVRFLGDHRKIADDFSHLRRDCTEDLRWWDKLIRNHSSDMAEIYAYFNNHYSGHAPSTASQLKDMLYG
jgi:uncharacterized protein YecE (DUF72 family)